MTLILWGAAIVATIGARGLAVLLVVPPLLGGALWYLTRSTTRQTSRIQAATEKLRGLGGQG